MQVLNSSSYFSIAQFLKKCQSSIGGFGGTCLTNKSFESLYFNTVEIVFCLGGPMQYAHLAPTYAAVNALCIIGTKEAYDVIDR